MAAAGHGTSSGHARSTAGSGFLTRGPGRTRGRARTCGLLACTLTAALAVACGSSGAAPQVDSPTASRSTAADQAATTAQARAAATKLHLTAFGGTFDTPVWVGSPTGDARTWVLEKSGRVDLIAAGTKRHVVALDIHRKVLSSGGEQGLVGMAFHPNFAKNGRLFLYYTAPPIGDGRLVEYHARANGTIDPHSAKVRLRVPLDASYQNHNGGGMQFGPDGLLYLGVGDGGSGGDPDNHAQNPKVLMGKLLRLDVDHGLGAHQVPAANHWSSGAGGRPEVWAIGLRNPWRFSFDTKTHDLWIGDVGQDQVEEVDHVRQPLPASPNFGWRHYEGTTTYDEGTAITPDTRLLRPVFQYRHTAGCSISGGVVYRGRRIPALRGRYLYSDFCRSWIAVSNGRSVGKRIGVGVPGIAHIGLTGRGEIVAASPQTGKVYHLTAR